MGDTGNPKETGEIRPPWNKFIEISIPLSRMFENNNNILIIIMMMFPCFLVDTLRVLGWSFNIQRSMILRLLTDTNWQASSCCLHSWVRMLVCQLMDPAPRRFVRFRSYPLYAMVYSVAWATIPPLSSSIRKRNRPVVMCDSILSTWQTPLVLQLQPSN